MGLVNLGAMVCSESLENTSDLMRIHVSSDPALGLLSVVYWWMSTAGGKRISYLTTSFPHLFNRSAFWFIVIAAGVCLITIALSVYIIFYSVT